MPGKKYKISEERKRQTTTISDDQLSSGITNNIREAVRSYKRNAYDKYFNLIKQAENSEEKDLIPLNSSFGNEKVEQNGRVISFNVAGSSFAQPLRYEEGLAGKTNIWLDDLTTGERVHIKKGHKEDEYIFTDQNGNETRMSGEKAVKAYAQLQNDRVFGKGGEGGHDDIRKLESADGKKIKYSISGPRISLLGLKNDFGLLNAGEYSIQNTREYIAKMGEEQIQKLYDDPVFRASSEEIFITNTGHSRGGVGTIEGAMRLKYIIHEKFPEIEHRIHFSALLYDPVPGPKNRLASNVNHAINLKEQTKEMKEAKMLPFDEKDHCTVMYSMGCNNKTGFTPMKVMGADTVILTGHSHDEGLKDLEEQFGEKKRKAYINSENGQAYRASGLMNMPKGVYISDEDNVMIKADDPVMVEHVIDKTYTREDKAENNRIRRICEVCTDNIVREYDSVPTLETIIRGFNAHDPFYVRSHKEFRNMKAEFENLMDLKTADQPDEKAMLESRMHLKAYAQEYIQSKAGKGPHSNRTQGRINVAKNLIRFLDAQREIDMKFDAKTMLDNTPKSNDMRDAYRAGTYASFIQNQSFLEDLSGRYQKGEAVETDMFKHTLTSMLVDRYFMRHEDIFMPQPLTDTQEKPEKLKQMDTLLGSNKHSIYDVFAKSTVVNEMVKDMIDKGEELELFASGDIQKVNKRLDMITYSIEKEVAQNVLRTPVKEDPSKMLKTVRIKDIPTVKSPNLFKL